MVWLLIVLSILSGRFSPCRAGELKYGGTVETFGAVYFQGKGNTENQYIEGRFRPYLTYTRDNLLFHLEGDIRPDSAGYARGSINDIAERSGRRWIVDVREGYADYSHEWFRARIGKQIFDWSVTDTISPADNISPRDWTDIVKWERVGVPALDVRLGYTSFVEVVFLPFFTPSKLPVIGGRWARDLPPNLDQGFQEILGRYHTQVAVRTGTNMAGFDLGASFYRGYSYSPSFTLQPTSLFTANIIPVYRLEEVYSISMAREVKGFNLRSEVGYFNQQREDDFVLYVAGIDREWSGLIRPVDSLYVLVQYANAAITKHNNPIPFPTLDFRRILDNAIMTKIQYNFDSEKRWTLKFEGAFNLRKNDNYFEPALVWRQSNFEVESGLDIFSGRKATFFGGYSQNDRVYLKVKYKF